MQDYGSFEYGGVKFTRLVPQEEITAYVSSLSDDKKGDIQKIVMSLEAAGLLDIEQSPPGVSTVQEQQMGFAQNPCPGDVTAKSYGAIEATSPTLSAHHGSAAGQGEEVRQEIHRLQAEVQQAQRQSVPQYSAEDTSHYAGQPPVPSRQGSISSSLKVNTSYLHSQQSNTP